MATTIRPEVAIGNKYQVEKHRYYELKHFADLVDQKKTMSPVMDEKASENILKITSKIDGTIGDL